MKRILTVTLVLVLALSLSSCILNFQKLGGEYEGYYYESSYGSVTVANYDPNNMFAIPAYQEMVMFGDGVGDVSEGVVYYIIVGGDVGGTDAEDGHYYIGEFHPETREILYEEGSYFADEETKMATVEKLMDLADYVYENFGGEAE